MGRMPLPWRTEPSKDGSPARERAVVQVGLHLDDRAPRREDVKRATLARLRRSGRAVDLREHGVSRGAKCMAQKRSKPDQSSCLWFPRQPSQLPARAAWYRRGKSS